MAIPILKSAIENIRDYYQNYPSCDFFETCSYERYTVDDISTIISKEAAEEYAQWIYENEK